MSPDPKAAREFSIEVIAKLRAAGYEAYWAGGCVRDRLLGATPKDYDVATSARPEQIRHLFGRRRTLAIGASFGVISVLGPKPAGPIEVATFREDADYSDGRRPDHVRFTDAAADAQRRDFTINGMFYDPVAEQTIDFVDGQQDLQDGVIRAIGDPHDRIGEDKLRMLRAVRFATVLDFAIDPATLDAVRAHADDIRLVSAERIGQELRRIFAHPQRRRGLTLLADTKLLAILFPELWRSFCDPTATDQAALPGTDSGPDRWTTLLSAVDHFGEPTAAELTLAALIRPRFQQHGAEIVAELSERLRLSRDEQQLMLHVLNGETLVRQADRQPWPKVQRVLAERDPTPLIEFTQAFVTAEGADDRGLLLCRRKLQLPQSQWNPDPLLNGKDLKTLGASPGPRFRELLDAVRDQQLLGEIRNRDQALAWVREQLAE